MYSIEKKSQNRVSVFGEDALAEHDAVALALLIQQRKLSASEVIDACIHRIQRANEHLNAIVVERFAEARQEVDSPLGRGFFAGLPMLIKDNIDFAGLPTLAGSKALPSTPAKKHAAMTRNILQQGFICLGKTRLPELGLAPTTEFDNEEPTRNPWHMDYSAGGSSGGAAALVACGALPIAHANDGGGSIRIPAACCGLVGLKPTRRRSPLFKGAKYLTIDICEGVLTRTVRDTAMFYAEMEKHHPASRLPAIGLVTGPARKRLKIGYCTSSRAFGESDEATQQAVIAAAKLLADQGHHVYEIPPLDPPGFFKDFDLYWRFLTHVIRRFGKLVLHGRFDSDRLQRSTHKLADTFNGKWFHLPGVIWRLRRAGKQLRTLFEQHDAVLTPVLGRQTVKLGHFDITTPFNKLQRQTGRYVGFTPLQNVAGTPAIALPFGLNSCGLPLGIQLAAGMGQEKRLLELAFEIELAQPFPSLASISRQSRLQPQANSATV